MSQWDKLLERLHSLDSDLRFEELKKILKRYGYIMNAPKSGSSHCTFRKSGCMRITIPNHKKIYIEMVRDIVESEANTNENDR